MCVREREGAMIECVCACMCVCVYVNNHYACICVCRLDLLVLIDEFLGLVQLSIRDQDIERVGGGEEVAGTAFKGALIPSWL